MGATVFAYLPAITNGLVAADGEAVLSPALRTVWSISAGVGPYIPVLGSLQWAEHRLWGEAPLGYHLVSVLLHAAGAVIFAGLLRRLGAGGALLAALLLALHPVAVESVAWIAAQQLPLALVFYLAAAAVFLRDRGGPRGVSQLTGLVWFCLALLTHPATATLPLTLLIVRWWQDGPLAWRPLLASLLPWFALAAVAAGWAAGRPLALAPSYEGWVGALAASRAIGFYLGKLVWPVSLVASYPRWPTSPAAGWADLALVGAAGLGLLVWQRRQRTRAPVAVGLLFVISLLPAFVAFAGMADPEAFVADRFQAFACLPIFAGLAAAWDRFFRRALPAAIQLGGQFATLLVLGGYVALTWDHCRDFRDEPTFEHAILAANPGAGLAHLHLANLLRATGHRQEAILHYQDAIRARPGDPEAENNLGLTLAAAGSPAGALPHYERALALNPRDAAVENNFANALWSVGRRDEAIRHYQAAIADRPEDAGAWYNLGLSEGVLGKSADAVAALTRAIQLRPDLPGAHHALAGARNNWGVALAAAGEFGDAQAQFEQALRDDPHQADAERNLARLHQRQGAPAGTTP